MIGLDFLPRPESQSEVVQRASNFHNCICKSTQPISEFIFNNPVSLTAAYNMFHPNSHS